MKVLNLVTTRKPFFEEQCSILRQKGIDITTIQVPGRESQDDTRSVLDYARIYPQVLQYSIRDFDIVHVNFGLTGPLALFQPIRPVVLTLWGTDLAGKYGRVSRYCAQWSNEVIVMSEEMKSDLGQDAHVVPHGINMDKFRPINQSEAQAAVGWDQDVKHVLFPYKPSRKVKNYPLAEHVVAEVQDEIPVPVELHAVYGVNHDDIPSYMNAADALLLTSHREGFPNSVKEAMACNLPVVSTDVGGVRDRLSSVSNSHVGTTETELIDYIVRILESQERSNGRDYIDDLSLDQMADNIISVYEKALP